MNRFITDVGTPVTLTDTVTGEEINLGRFGVWGSNGHGSKKVEVLACGDDLEALQKEYGPNLPVHPLPQRA